MRQITIAITQMPCTGDRAENIRNAAALVTEAAGQGAQVVLLQELLETPYFCIDRDPSHLSEAMTLAANPAVAVLRPLAQNLGVVIPVPFYELGDDGKRFNSVAMIDADGAILGVYRKSHIPDFPAYEEAFYFTPGDTGFRVWDTAFGRIGVGICWDQWFPEAARIMALKGAEVLLYPTAIGWPVRGETNEPLDSRPHWQRTMQGHAAANQVVVAAANRIGNEAGQHFETQFYGGSFIADPTGAIVTEMDENTSGVAIARFDLDAHVLARKRWGMYRTRRPDLYEAVTGEAPSPDLMVRHDD